MRGTLLQLTTVESTVSDGVHQANRYGGSGKSRRNNALLGAAILSTAVLSARAWATTFIQFDHRENLNILNSPEVSIIGTTTSSASSYSDANLLRGAAHDATDTTVGWYSGYFGAADKAVLTMDLGAVRNIKTIRIGGQRVANSATIETSPDGIIWSGGLANTATTIGVDVEQRQFTLDTAVNSRFLRFTGDSYSFVIGDPPLRSLALDNFRVYGDVGTVTADASLDLVSKSAWTAGGPVVTTTQSGAQYTPGYALYDMANDVPESPAEGMTTRQLIYSLGAGKHVTATFGQAIDDIGRVGVTIANGLAPVGFDPDMHFQFLGSNDGFATSTVLIDQVGGLVNGQNFFTLPSLVDGMTAVRFKIVSAETTGNRISDLFVFQGLPTVTSPTSVWAVDDSGDWNEPTNWTGAGVPNSVGATARFLGAIMSTQTVFTDSAVTVGAMVFDNSNSYVISGGGSLTIDVSSGAGSIDVLNGSHKINLPLILADSTVINVGTTSTLTIGNPTTMAGGTGLVKRGAGTLTVQSTLSTPSASILKINGGVVNLDAANNETDLSAEMDPASTLNLGADQTLGGMALSHGGNVIRVGRNSSGATVPAKLTLSGLTVSLGAGAPSDTLDQPLTGNTTKVTGVLQINAFSGLAKQGAGVLSVGSLNLASTAQLDLTDGKLMVDYSGASPLTNVLALITSGRASGAWNGYGINSSTAATTAQRALGYVDTGVTGAQLFGGESADGSAILIGYTVLGDATLDGTVNSLDFNALVAGYGTVTNGQWFRGDFDYDGKVNTIDFNYLAGNFGTVLPSPSLGAVVPEPTAGVLIMATTSLVMGSRKRRIVAR